MVIGTPVLFGYVTPITGLMALDSSEDILFRKAIHGTMCHDDSAKPQFGFG
jgi:hypothetical protein